MPAIFSVSPFLDLTEDTCWKYLSLDADPGKPYHPGEFGNSKSRTFHCLGETKGFCVLWSAKSSSSLLGGHVSEPTQAANQAS